MTTTLNQLISDLRVAVAANPALGDQPVLVSNGMGCPAYDYQGQRFAAHWDDETKTVKMTKEVAE